MTILAIETSCDETSVALLRNDKILANVVASQIVIHQPYGGVVPELAARAHTDNIHYVLKTALLQANLTYDAIDYVAYTCSPGLISCLHVGKVIAQTLASYLEVPLIPCNHLYGHIYASLIDNQWNFPVLGLLVSGGHTQLLLIKNHIQVEIIGETVDDAAGECYDKIARILQLPYPGGPEIAKLATFGTEKYHLPLPKNDQSFNFSFSGLKSHAATLIQKEGDNLDRPSFCASLQNTITTILLRKLEIAIQIHQPKTVVLAGGVSANEHLRQTFLKLKQKYQEITFLVPKLEYATDNAAMIAILAKYMITKGELNDFRNSR